MSIVKIPEHQLDLTNITARIDTAQNDLADLGDQVSNIESKIPAEASDRNQLADKAFVNEEVGKINFVKWVTVLPSTGETKYLYAIAREEQDLEGHYIAALYVWDGSAWRGAGGYSLNINPADFALKTDLDDLGGQVSVIESKIPAEASETNQLADKNYVDSVSSGSGFDFEGTKAEFDAAVAAGTITADSVSLITDDVDGANVATKAELQAVENNANNLTNISAQGKSLVSGLGMPSNRYIDLTLGASGTTYTAPANGYFDLRKGANDGQHIQILGQLETKIFCSSGTNNDISAFMPMRKGDSIIVWYNASGTTFVFRFVYAEGSKSEDN